MSGFSVDVSENRVKEAKEKVEKAIELALEECGAEAERYAKMLCPTDTGLLKNSITYALHGKGPITTAYVADNPDESGNIRRGEYGGTAPDDEKAVYIGTNVEYAAYVEMGSSRYDKKPYLKPALEEHIDKYKGIFEKHLSGS